MGRTCAGLATSFVVFVVFVFKNDLAAPTDPASLGRGRLSPQPNPLDGPALGGERDGASDLCIPERENRGRKGIRQRKTAGTSPAVRTLS